MGPVKTAFIYYNLYRAKPCVLSLDIGLWTVDFLFFHLPYSLFSLPAFLDRISVALCFSGIVDRPSLGEDLFLITFRINDGVDDTHPVTHAHDP